MYDPTLGSLADHSVTGGVIFRIAASLAQGCSSQVGSPYMFTGRRLDPELTRTDPQTLQPTGLYYYRARYMDTAEGRFISRDPVGVGAGGSNLYWYVGNNPTNAKDSSGQVIGPDICERQQPQPVAPAVPVVAPAAPVAAPVPPDCSKGGCVKAKDAEIKEVTLTKMERQAGSDFSCRAVTQGLAITEMRKLVEGKGEHKLEQCGEGCECGKYTMSDAQKMDLVLTDQVFDLKGDVDLPGIGKVTLHCIFEVSGTIKLSAGEIGVARCVPKK
jgi:RHS repeat-associated protein